MTTNCPEVAELVEKRDVEGQRKEMRRNRERRRGGAEKRDVEKERDEVK